MKTEVDGIRVAAGLAKVLDKILNVVIFIALMLLLFYGVFGLMDTLSVYSNAGVSDDILKYKPALGGDGGSNPTLTELKNINPDTKAWIVVDNTNISYPILQGKSNLDYINTDFSGEFSLSGSIFIDYRNSGDFSDIYTLTYGHHMEGKMMFGELPLFQEKKFFDEHRTGVLFLENATYAIDIFACLHTDAYDENVFNPTAYKGLVVNDNLLSRMKKIAVQYDDELSIGATDRIIALSTCYDATTNGRIIVLGRLREYSGGLNR